MYTIFNYLLVWVLSFLFPGIIYFLLQLLKKKDIAENKPSMPFFNKFSIILLAIFASINVILYHLVFEITYVTSP